MGNRYHMQATKTTSPSIASAPNPIPDEHTRSSDPGKYIPAFLIYCADSHPDGEWLKAAFEELQSVQDSHAPTEHQNGAIVSPPEDMDGVECDPDAKIDSNDQTDSDGDDHDPSKSPTRSGRIVIDLTKISMG